MTWSVGANDLANIMSTALGSKAISARQAFILAIIFEVAGALLGGSHVARTVQHGIINISALHCPPEIIVYGMLAVLLSSATWMALASFIGMPVSITNAIIGALVGFGLLILGVDAVHWRQVSYIAISWIACPIIAASLAYFLFFSMQRLIFNADSPEKSARNYAPIYLFLVGFILAEMTVIKILMHFGYHIHLILNLIIGVVSGVMLILITMPYFKKLKSKGDALHQQFAHIEKIFSLLMMFTACAMIYAHGSNDIATSVGPIAAIISLLHSGHSHLNGGLILSILALGSCGVLFGFVTYGKKVIATVGSGITVLTPSRAYCATIAAALTVVVSTSIGIPVSATQTLVGGIVGVGLARGIGALDLRVVRSIFASWLITVPIVAVFAVVYFNIIKSLFSI
ncbi:MAG: inorganic phosphate transporter [Gammaproteobacteria bacterium]|nr:inorganic phosphate transporter [Gammaproteobacteria bacterium]